jgi:hypothetical protein
MLENSVKIEPEEFVDLLKYSNGDVAAIAKFPQYRGKQIIIDGNLSLNGIKDIKNFNIIAYVNGNLDISWSSVDYFDQTKVRGNFGYYGSSMSVIEEKKKTQKKLNELDVLRANDEWDVTKNTKDGNESEAVYDFLVDEGIPQEYEDENGEEKIEDKYFLFMEPYSHYGGSMFTWLGDDSYKQEYVVYSSDQLDAAVKESVVGHIDELGYEAAPDYVFQNNLNEDYVESWLNDFYYETVQEDPDSWEVGKELSSQQEKYVQIYKTKIDKLTDRLKNETLSDDERSNIESEVDDLDTLIEDITDDPQGDYSDEEMDDIVKALVSDASYNFSSWLKDMGFDDKFIMDFIDMDAVIEELSNNAEPGDILGSYDGSMSEYEVNGLRYYVMRYN